MKIKFIISCLLILILAMGIVSAQDLNDNSDFDDYLSDGLGTNSVSIGDNAISQDTSLDTKYGYEDSSDKIESMKNSINDLEVEIRKLKIKIKN